MSRVKPQIPPLISRAERDNARGDASSLLRSLGHIPVFQGESFECATCGASGHVARRDTGTWTIMLPIYPVYNGGKCG